MSLQPEATSSKKRKHGETSNDGAAANTNSLTPAHSHSHKKAKKKKKEGHAAHRSEKKSKSSSKKSKTDSQFRVVNASILVSIPPKFFADPLAGVHEMLDSLVMKYVPALSGVVLAHTNAKFASRTAIIRNECPFSNCTVNFNATVWSPQIGMKLTGRIKLCSPDHIAILIHRTFNVSIPRHHIPTDNWEFEYGALEEEDETPNSNDPNTATADSQENQNPNDEESGNSKSVRFDNTTDTGSSDPTAAVVDKDKDSTEDELGEPSLGYWVHKVTGEKLGDKNGQLEFTVIGLTIANQMLSLVGSIQPDPFSPEHIPKPVIRPPSNSDVDALSVEKDLPLAELSELDSENDNDDEAEDEDEIEDWDEDDGGDAKGGKKQQQQQQQQRRGAGDDGEMDVDSPPPPTSIPTPSPKPKPIPISIPKSTTTASAGVDADADAEKPLKKQTKKHKKSS